jgi:hypothetical protein
MSVQTKRNLFDRRLARGGLHCVDFDGAAAVLHETNVAHAHALEAET